MINDLNILSALRGIDKSLEIDSVVRLQALVASQEAGQILDKIVSMLLEQNQWLEILNKKLDQIDKRSCENEYF